MTTVGPRRRAREIALQILIQLDVNPEIEVEHGIRLYFDHLAMDASSEDGDDDVPAGRAMNAAHTAASLASPSFDRKMVDDLVRGVAKARTELDEIVQGLSRNWRLERMALVERNVIRLALYELKYAAEVPTNVALDEAIELTKRFGTAEGGAFVNGLLDRAVTELGLRR
jgi:transcription antitermination factor NusB